MFLSSLASSRLWAYLWVHLLIIEFFGLGFFFLFWPPFTGPQQRYHQTQMVLQPHPQRNSILAESEKARASRGLRHWCSFSRLKLLIRSEQERTSNQQWLNAERDCHLVRVIKGWSKTLNPGSFRKHSAFWSRSIFSALLPLHIQEAPWFAMMTACLHWISSWVPGPACKVLCMNYFELHPIVDEQMKIQGSLPSAT